MITRPIRQIRVRKRSCIVDLAVLLYFRYKI